MNHKLSVIAIVLSSVAVGLFIWSRCSSPKIAYVRSAVLVDKYTGMKEARNVYKDKTAKWKANIDTLKNDYSQALGRYNQEITKLSSREKQEREEYLQKQEANIRQYIGSLEEKAREEDHQLTEGVINQINSYVKEYGEKKGYDLIFGTTTEGNILYGREAVDVTDEVLKGLNNSYGKKGETAQ